MSSIMERITNIGQSSGTQIGNIGDSIKTGVSQAVSGFSETSGNVSGSDFLQSNGIIAKFAFIILVILGFALLLNLGIAVIAYFLSPPPSPYLVNGMIEGNNGMVISQDPRLANSITILRSDNQTTGLEFTWSTWLYVTDPGSNSGTGYQNIFNKGNGIYTSMTSTAQTTNMDSFMETLGISHTTDEAGKTTYIVPGSINAAIKSQINIPNRTDPQTLANIQGALGVHGAINTNTGMASVNNGPGLYIVSNASTASIVAVMDTVDTQNPTQSLKIDNCPINKWFHVAIRMENNIMDVYINGTISGRTLLTGVPKQNYNDVNICQNGGFAGKLSNLRYHNKALSSFEINNIVRSGPNIKPVDSSVAETGYSYYLADSWFYSKLKSM
jgi:hypothetical protein